MAVCSTKTNKNWPNPSSECIVHGAEQWFSISACLCVHPRRKGEPGLLSSHFSQSSNIWRAEHFVGRSSPKEFGHGSDWLLSVGVTKDSFRDRKIKRPIRQCQEQTILQPFLLFLLLFQLQKFQDSNYSLAFSPPPPANDHFPIFQVPSFRVREWDIQLINLFCGAWCSENTWRRLTLTLGCNEAAAVCSSAHRLTNASPSPFSAQCETVRVASKTTHPPSHACVSPEEAHVETLVWDPACLWRSAREFPGLFLERGQTCS